MARLTKSDRLYYQRQWLDVWEKAGGPSLRQKSISFGARSYNEPFGIEHVDYVQQTYGVASKLRIWLNGQCISKLVAILCGERLCKGETINVRSSGGRNSDEASLARSVYQMHMAAAIAHKHIEAVRAGDEALARATELDELTSACPVLPLTINQATRSTNL